MSKTVGNSNNGVDRSTRSRTSSSRKCCACQCQQASQEPSRVGRKRTSVKPSKSNAHVNKPRKVGPDVLPSIARAKSSVQLRPDAVKYKPRKTATVSAETSAALVDENTNVSQETIGDVKEVAQASRTRRIKQQPALPPKNSTTVTTATPRQIWRKKVDSTPHVNKTNRSTTKLKTPAVPKQEPAINREESEDEHYDDIDSAYHITWDGFDEPEYRIGEDCGFCEIDLAVAPGEDDSETEFSTIPVVAMLPCGHAFHVECLDQAELGDIQGEPICVLCQSIM
ncbi:hypothetical protein RND81_06G174600 [Saponaria officinalis]|uniref:RING-type domain-containing protein n=1 Tax=Saponaria officinalis TaxID=3572 RepID=A0AAW1KE43_SAPOF